MLKTIKKTYKYRKNKIKKSKRHLEPANCFLTESEDKRRRKRLSFFILVLAVLLILVPCVMLLKEKIEMKMTTQTQQEVVTEQQGISMALIMYLNYTGYDEFCTKLGVPLTIYPMKFAHRFRDEGDFLIRYLKITQRMDFSRGFAPMREKFSPILEKSITTNFDKAIPTLITRYAPDKKTLTYQEVCQIMENHADDLLDNPLTDNFKRVRDIYQKLKQKYDKKMPH